MEMEGKGLELAEQKKMMRREIKAQIGGLKREYCQMADKAIFHYITSLPEYEEAKTLFCFVSMGGEINTAPVILDALGKGKRVGVPRCVERGIMEVRCIDSLDSLKEEGPYKIPEPGEGAPILCPEEIDLAVVPCLSCSSDGRRLGYGGGYYDRYLIKANAFKAVVCRAEIMREGIPVGAYDQVMDMVISEKGVKRLSRQRQGDNPMAGYLGI